MESKSKIQLTKDQIIQLVKYSLNKTCIDSQELTNGWFNTIHRVTLNDNSTCILKISPPPSFKVMRYEKDILNTEQQILFLFNTWGIPSPKVIKYVETNPIFNHPCFFMECVEGITLQSYKEKKRLEGTVDFSVMNRSLGILQADINNLGLQEKKWGLPASGVQYKTWGEALNSLVSDLLADADDNAVKLPVPAADIQFCFTDAKEYFKDVTQPSLIHWDLHDGNILVSDEGKITGVIDCDRALYADPLMEFWFRSMANSDEDFYTGYKETIHKDIIDFSKLSKEVIAKRIRLYDLYLALVLRIECAFREYGADHMQWTEEKLKKYLEEVRG